jgi:phosphomannomutase
MTSKNEDVIARAKRWAEEDPDEDARREIEKLLAAPDVTKTDLADRFAASLEFGTAGLRGVIGAGPNRMNRAVVIRTTAGLAQYLKETVPDGAKRGVAIAYDGRRMSVQFANDTAAVLAAAGIDAYLFEEMEPTPVLAYAVKELGCAAGVMITASHNPPEYNGYKAYWGNGAQIVPPTDVGIAKAIDAIGPAKDVARTEGRAKRIGQALEDKYLAEVAKLSVAKGGKRDISIVYTPMHGVGDKLTRRALAAAGFPNVFSVPEQQHPDGAFPTVEFPNPEEKGAMDLAFALARKSQADLVLANDPDADRLAVAVPSNTSQSGYVQLTGNQVGVLLGHYLLTGGLASMERAVKVDGAEPLVIASIVSSPMLGVIAHGVGAHYDEVLTGFKWIANRAMELSAREGFRFVFGFEEALGYTVGELVRDKDGVSAAVLFAELAAVLKERRTDVLAHLEELYRRFGLFTSGQVNITRKGAEGLKELKAIMAKLRENPTWEIAGDPVVSIRDYLRHTITAADGSTRKLELPASDVLAFELASGCRVIARPSGTEPKAKFYFDVREGMKPGESLAEAEARASATMKRLSEAFVRLATG